MEGTSNEGLVSKVRTVKIDVYEKREKSLCLEVLSEVSKLS